VNDPQIVHSGAIKEFLSTMLGHCTSWVFRSWYFLITQCLAQFIWLPKSWRK